MKWIAVLLTLWGGSLWAAAHQPHDPAILGKYLLHTADPHSEIQWAEIRVNPDNQWVVTTSRNDEQEFKLSGPNDHDLIFEGSDEANCDGDEPSCVYDLETKIWLRAVNNRPQLTISITTDNAWDDSGKSQKTTTYVLDWSEALPDAISYFSNSANPSEVEVALKACKSAIDLWNKGGTSYSHLVCGSARTVHYRNSFAEAFPYYTKYYLGKKRSLAVKKIDRKRLQQLFAEHDRTVSAHPVKGSKIEILRQTRKIHDLIARFNEAPVFYVRFANDAVFFVVNEREKTIVTFSFDTGWR